jgi:hypothetical protein
MKKNINNQLTKALVAIKNVEALNEVCVEPDPQLRNHLITIEELLKEILYKEN